VLIRRRWIWTIAALGAALTVALIVLASAVPLRSESLKRRIVETLAQRLNSEVTLDQLSLRLFPRLHAEAAGLRIRQRNQPAGTPPLIAIDRFEADADLIGLVRKHVAHVELAGLVVSIPPDPDDDPSGGDVSRPEEHRLHPSSGTTADADPTADDGAHIDPASIEGGVIIDKLDTKDARLVIIPKESGKEPKTWAIHRLRMRSLGVTQAMPFQATLTNAVPPGEIAAVGRFGPWNSDSPGRTPLGGKFTFDKADLSVFKGVSGTLSSQGAFRGSLNYIDVHGETETPDFAITVGGHPFGLHTNYHAIVDGTTGDTRLERIDAAFLRSKLTAKGAVLDSPAGQKGRTVQLDVTMPDARIEDVMLMAVKTKPPMTGALKLTTAFLLPPGDADVVDRLKLNGRFSITHAKFMNYDVQGKIVELSYRGRGKVEDQRTEQIASDFEGRFVYENATLKLPDITFGVPGARVHLAGVYHVKRETLAFKGDLLLAAKVSQTVTGLKSLLLKMADPLFRRKGGGSQIPIKIEGTRDDPKFGLDFSRVFKKGN
jgi:hypothetical protein